MIWKKVDSLKNLQSEISAIEQHCSRIITPTESAKYIKLLLQGIQEEVKDYGAIMTQDITQLKESLPSGEDFTALTQKNSRNKRAIFPFGSKVLKFLYGTPDVDDTEDYSSKFEELYKNQHKQQELNKVNYLVVKDIFSILNVTATKTNYNFLYINNFLNALNDMLQNLNFDVILLTISTELGNLFQCFQGLVTILYQDIDSLQNAILFSRKNVLRPYIINEKNLK